MLVAMVRTAPPEEPTILEVLAQKILDQTVNCGGEFQMVTGSPLANFCGTPTITEDRPGYTRLRSTDPVTPSTWSGTASSGKSPDTEKMLRRLISMMVGPELTDRPVVSDEGLRQRRNHLCQ